MEFDTSIPDDPGIPEHSEDSEDSLLEFLKSPHANSHDDISYDPADIRQVLSTSKAKQKSQKKFSPKPSPYNNKSATAIHHTEITPTLQCNMALSKYIISSQQHLSSTGSLVDRVV